jgi:hypothetical protein
MSDAATTEPDEEANTDTSQTEWMGWSVAEESVDEMTLKHAGGRTIKVHIMDMGDTMDLVEATEGVPSGALDRWMHLAIPVVSVVELDGSPIPKSTTRDRIRARARQLGNERFAAVQWALFMRKPNKSAVDTAKNS